MNSTPSLYWLEKGRENEKRRDDSKRAYQDASQTLEHAQLVSLLALFKFLDGCTESVHIQNGKPLCERQWHHNAKQYYGRGEFNVEVHETNGIKDCPVYVSQLEDENSEAHPMVK